MEVFGIMNVAIKIIGIFFVTMAVSFLMRPEWILNVIQFAAKGSRVYIIGAIRLFLAATFLLAARDCARPLIIAAFGVLFLICGVYIFAAGADRMRSMMEWFQKKPLWLFRLLAVVHFVFGCLIIYAV
jgi:hypothetical protein